MPKPNGAYSQAHEPDDVNKLTTRLFDASPRREPVHLLPHEREPQPVAAQTRRCDNSAMKHHDLVAFNSEAERAFLQLAKELLDEGDCSPSELVQEACFVLDVSKETARRYLFKHTARRASLGIREGLVFLRAGTHTHTHT